MASDNIFDQVEALIASDDRQKLPETVDAILKLTFQAAWSRSSCLGSSIRIGEATRRK